MHSIHSILNRGSSGLVIDVECNFSNGLPIVIIVGLGNKSIDEAKERIRSAFTHSKIDFPRKRIVINLAPADIPKDSTAFDLAIAAAILQAKNEGSQNIKASDAFIGELGLDGKVRAVRGIIGQIINGKAHGLERFFIPHDNLEQAQLIPNTKLVPIETLAQFNDLVFNPRGSKIDHTDTGELTYSTHAHEADLLDHISGQAQAKRALEIAAAGGHNIFLTGPPGTGKSMLAKALPSLMAPMTAQEILEATHIHSLAGHSYGKLVLQRPFRSPHHSASLPSIVGGGTTLKPGEVSLAHKGILFLDEMPEFPRSVLEALRQPLEDKFITIARANDTVSFPSDFILVATANPCPCGYFGSAHECTCTANQLNRYRQRVSAPILDRIDLHVTVDHVDHKQLLSSSPSSSLEKIRANIVQARNLQTRRYGKANLLNTNLDNKAIKQYVHMDRQAESILLRAATQLAISARSYMRIIKVAQTIADLAQDTQILPAHMMEALQYRPQNTA